MVSLHLLLIMYSSDVISEKVSATYCNNLFEQLHLLVLLNLADEDNHQLAGGGSAYNHIA